LNHFMSRDTIMECQDRGGLNYQKEATFTAGGQYCLSASMALLIAGVVVELRGLLVSTIYPVGCLRGAVALDHSCSVEEITDTEKQELAFTESGPGLNVGAHLKANPLALFTWTEALPSAKNGSEISECSRNGHSRMDTRTISFLTERIRMGIIVLKTAVGLLQRRTQEILEITIFLPPLGKQNV
jgi:hypothetical protein